MFSTNKIINTVAWIAFFLAPALGAVNEFVVHPLKIENEILKMKLEYEKGQLKDEDCNLHSYYHNEKLMQESLQEFES
jgi:hypothetical protein